MKRSLTAVATAMALIAVTACGNQAKTASGHTGFPKIDQNGKVAIAAHRGFWNCEAAGYTQNSIASLKAAQDAGLWGSELDIHVTSDDVVVVNHDDKVGGIDIHSHSYADLKDVRLKNGEKVPTFDEYLTQGEKSETVLVVELKIQASEAREDVLLDKTVELLKAHRLFSPERVVFISFSYHICEAIAAKYPQFINQYLNGEKSPEELYMAGINGLDYHKDVLAAHPDWPAKCAGLGMSSNVWTVNSASGMEKAIGYGVNTITTNEPLRLRKILGDREYKRK